MNKRKIYLNFKNAEIGYKKNVLIKNLNLEIQQGEKILLSGSNGTGKTTFFKTILGFIPLLKGEIQKNFEFISYVPQNLEISTEFLITIYEVLDLYYNNKLVPFEKTQKKKQTIYDILNKFNLLEKKDLLLKECSGGELQKTFIARALLKKPEFLILDEPLNAVDLENQKQFFHLLSEIYDEYQCTILMSSHILVEDSINFFNKKFIIKNQQIFEL